MTARTAARPKTDYILLTVTLMLTCFGILLIYDASYAYTLQIHANAFKYAGQQLVYAIIGIVTMLAVRRMDYHILAKGAVVFAGVVALLLACVYIPHIGAGEVNGARRWIGLSSLKFQPSELAKLAIVLYVARLCAGRPRIMNDFATGPLAPVCVLAVFAVLVAPEPDLGTCMVIMATGLSALMFAGMKMRHAIATVIAAAILLGGLYSIKGHHSAQPVQPTAATTAAPARDYRNSRIWVWMHPNASRTGEGYQVYHSMIALGTGGVFGLGVGNGRQKYYLPEAHTDFILATAGEEGGLLATLFTIGLFVVLVGRGMHIASMTKDPFAAIVAGGISAGFAVQAILNIAVVTASVPDTGVPLPFLSYGGTSLLISLISVGILLSIYRNSEWDDDGRTEIASSAPERDFDRRWNRGSTLSRPEYARGGTYRGSKGYRDTLKPPRSKSPAGF